MAHSAIMFLHHLCYYFVDDTIRARYYRSKITSFICTVKENYLNYLFYGIAGVYYGKEQMLFLLCNKEIISGFNIFKRFFFHLIAFNHCLISFLSVSCIRQMLS